MYIHIPTPNTSDLVCDARHWLAHVAELVGRARCLF